MLEHVGFDLAGGIGWLSSDVGRLSAVLATLVLEDSVWVGRLGMTEISDAEFRAQLNEELGFYPANLDEESVAGYRREHAEDRERHARWKRKYDGPGGSHYNQFRHLIPKRTPPPSSR